MRKLIGFLFLFFILFNLQSQENKNSQGKTFIIPIKGEINKALAVFIRRSIEKAKLDKSDYIIFEIDTFGGRVDSALQITTLIGSLDKIKSIAYVTSGGPESTGVSWSAGALISFSCSKIYMAPGTSIGAAAPVYQTSEGMKSAPEKEVSAIRTQIASIAEKNGYSKNIAMAMVDKDIELIEVYVDAKLNIATPDELKILERKAKESGQKIEIGRTIVAKDKLLSLTAKEMEFYGISSGTKSSRKEIFTDLNINNNVIEASQSPFDQLLAFLASSFFIGILVIIGFAAVYLEIRTPGFGIPGITGIICFAVVFAVNGLLGKVGSLEILMFVAGLVLLIIEIFLIPGFGITGVSGIILILVSLILSLQDFIIPKFDWQVDLLIINFVTVIISFLISILFFAVLAQFLPKTFLFTPLTLKTAQSVKDGFTVQTMDVVNKLNGKKGKTATILRPSGKAEIEGEIYEVQSEGEYIENGIKIQVVEVSGNKIIVRKC